MDTVSDILFILVFWFGIGLLLGWSGSEQLDVDNNSGLISVFKKGAAEIGLTAGIGLGGGKNGWRGRFITFVAKQENSGLGY